MANSDDDLFDEFKEFLKQKRENERQAADDEDFEIEIGDKDGNFVRTRRSHAKPFLQRLGLDVEPPKGGDGAGNGDGDGKNGRGDGKGAGKRTPAGNTGVARKYFTKK